MELEKSSNKVNFSERPTSLLATGANSELLQDITVYGILISVPLGFVLNSLSLILLIKSKDFSTSIGSHLKSLAVADNIQIIAILCCSLDNRWEHKLYIPQMYTMNIVYCKLTLYLLSVGLISTGVILASAIIERFFAVAFPLKFKSWNSNLLSKILIGIYFLVSFGISIFFLITEEFSTNGEKCMFSERYDDMMKIYLIVVSTIFANGICVGSLLLFSILIIVMLFIQRRKRVGLGNTSTSSSHKEFQITVMLVVVAGLFIILRLPKLIMLNVERHSFNKISWSNFTNILYLINHSVNFIIYLIFLEPFRKACKIFLCCRD